MNWAIVRGTLGWGNPTVGEMNHQLDAYGPRGRWHNEGRTQGQRLPDALVEDGAGEGWQLIVVAVDRFTDVDVLSNKILDVVMEAGKLVSVAEVEGEKSNPFGTCSFVYPTGVVCGNFRKLHDGRGFHQFQTQPTGGER